MVEYRTFRLKKLSPAIAGAEQRDGK